LQPVTSQGSVTLLNAIRCLHAGVTKWFQGSDREFRSTELWLRRFSQHGS
jgi:hypothetical protein